MSGNAALAAARRRRGEEPTNNIQSNKYNKQLQELDKEKSSIHPLQCILDHDKQIFILEKKFEKLEENMKNNQEPSADFDIMMQNNSSEIKLLKNSIQKQQKSISDLNGLVTSLRATISNQEKIIEDLAQQTQSLSAKENDEKKSTVKLDISDE